MTEKKLFKPLSRACELLGGQTAVADLCSLETGREYKQGHVSNWLRRDFCVPPDCAQAIAKKLNDRFCDEDSPSREDLCPNFAWLLFGEAVA